MFTAYKIPGVLATLKDQLKSKRQDRELHQRIVDKIDTEIMDLEESIKKLES